MSTATQSLHAAGVVYETGTDEPDALRSFARSLAAEGWRVAGLVQEVIRLEDGTKRGIDIIDLRTDARLPLSRNTREQLDGRVCTLDTAVLAEASAVLRQAIADKVDLIVVEKFGDRERRGAGLFQELTDAMMAGIPVLVAVPRPAIADWEAFTGSLAPLLPPTEEAMRSWWMSLRGEIGSASPI